MDELLPVFVSESREQLAALENALLVLETTPDDADILNAIFRAAHTIKGGAGVIECGYIVAFTHVVENVLDQLRNGDLQADADLIAILLACSDHIGLLLDELVMGRATPEPVLQRNGDTLLARLEHNRQSPEHGNLPPTTERERVGADTSEGDCWHISLRFERHVLRNGMDPLSFLRYLTTLGRIVHLETLTDALPPADEMDPEECYLGFEIRFASPADKAAIERVFDFVRDDCTLHILPPDSRLADYLELIQSLPEGPLRLGEILIRIGVITESELNSGLQQQQELIDSNLAPAGPIPLGELLVEQGAVQPELVEAAVARQGQLNDKKMAEARSIRIQADKLDRLIDLVGELVIASSSVSLLASQTGRGELTEAASLLMRLVEGTRDSALQLRMVQIGETFSRFNRIVRDVSKELGKEIDLVIAGGETELDKSVVEKISDPLIHLVRNAIDHGIESTAQRIAAGKLACGRLELNAFHDSGSIVLEVSDDGGGLNRGKIVAKAIERGLIPAGNNLSEAEIDNLIFEPGFSTADQVSNLSGRGVGMDVVKRNIQSLRGRVDVTSTPGAGTRFSIRLPLTMAIIDGFLVGAERASYVIPLDMVVECLELPSQTHDSHYLNLRGDVLPFIRLRELFDLPGSRPARENVVVVRTGNQKAGIVVDKLQGELQTVIKPLGQLFRSLRGIGGSTILGSGEVALILDVPSLIQLIIQQETQAIASRLYTPTT